MYITDQNSHSLDLRLIFFGLNNAGKIKTGDSDSKVFNFQNEVLFQKQLTDWKKNTIN